MHNAGRVVQGDILKDVMSIEWDITSEDTNDISLITKINFPYILILSQDCDLDHDFKNRNDQDA